jgi:hypothetical protein
MKAVVAGLGHVSSFTVARLAIRGNKARGGDNYEGVGR